MYSGCSASSTTEQLRIADCLKRYSWQTHWSGSLMESAIAEFVRICLSRRPESQRMNRQRFWDRDSAPDRDEDDVEDEPKRLRALFGTENGGCGSGVRAGLHSSRGVYEVINY
ncbi:hypothetical protein Q1695_012781 [Nippostrongylus brasiliensis]|nr:hypothetical protein Q1695_012781 [Nippostrongylus brasiliensis]